MKRANFWMGASLLALFWSGEAVAAVCTSQSAGTWNTAARWLCGGVARVPLATDTVVVAHNITLNFNTTIAGLTVNNGVSLIDDNNNRILTITGNLVIDGTINTGGSRISLNVTGAASDISGSGTVAGSTRLYISGAAVTIAAGSSLNFTGSSRLYTGRTEGGATVAGSVLTINGTINSTVTTATTTFLRLYANSTVVGSTGVINASVSAIRYYTATATLTNNGSVNVNSITRNAASNAWTQGVNSSLTVSAVSTVGTLNASANGNTVTYNGTSTAIAPGAAGYWNLAGTIYPGACPHGFVVSGTDPCPAGGPVSVTLNPSNCVNVAGIGTQAWGTPANAYTSNDAYATVSLNDFQVSEYLRCTGYGFAIPPGATILGVTVNVERRASNTGIRDAAMRLVRDVAGVATIQATDRSTLTNYTTADVIEAHGGAADLWGGAWTPADINLANFGAAFASQKPGAAGWTRTVSVDHMPIRVTYTTNTLHHVSINAPATAMSLTEVPVAIAPHTAAHAALTAAGTFNLSTSTGTGDWTIGSGTGTLTPGAANSGLATYTFGAAESSATLGFTSQSAGTVTLNIADSFGTDMLLSAPVGEVANTITFSAASFVFTGSACTHNVAFGTAGQCALVTWSPRIAGQALANIYVTSVNAAGVPTRLHPTQVRTRDIQFGLSCHDPIANAGVQATFSAAAAALPLCQANGVTPATWTAATTLSFPGGSPSVGPYSFNYGDVGKVEFWMRNSAATTELGSSGVFVVKPAGFTLSGIQRTSDSFTNPGAANAAGTAFVKAGDAFTVTVTAINSAAVATPNYGKEVTPESVKLTSALVPALGLTNNPAITGTFGSFAGGAATGTAFAWDEAGIITLTPSVLDADYLGASDTTGTVSGNVGRFYPHHFAVTPDAPPIDNRADLCSGGVLISDGVTPCVPVFTYMGEQMDANFTLTAQSLSNTTTQNYAGAFAKIDPAAASNPLGLGAVDSAVPTYLSARLDTSLPASGSFLAGNTAVSAPFSITRLAAADGPYAALDIGIAPVDSDGVTMGAFDLDTDATPGNDHALLGTTEVRYGRMRLSNAHGSELLPLTIAATAQYWDGAAFVTSATDSISSFAATDVTFGSYYKNLAAGETSVVTPPASVVFANGIASYQLAKPSGGDGNYDGSVDMTISVPGYLPTSAAARATFGVYKGANEFIYLRENY